METLNQYIKFKICSVIRKKKKQNKNRFYIISKSKKNK